MDNTNKNAHVQVGVNVSEVGGPKDTSKTKVLSNNANDSTTSAVSNENSAIAQRTRLLAALKKGSVTTLAARQSLDIVHPGARICELRQAGHQIGTVRVWEETVSGKRHLVGRYFLIASAQSAGAAQ